MKHGKKYRAAAGKLEEKVYSIEEAIAFVKENASAGFDESVEVHVRLATNPKKSDEAVRATASLPHGTGKKKIVAVVTSTQEKEAKEAGATLVGGEDLVAQIKEGKVNPGADFDVLLATPEMMPKLAMVAKILGPKGLMPSPKNETVAPKVADAVSALAKGSKISFKNDDSSNIHQVIGRVSFTEEQLRENIETFRETLMRAKPEALKGRFVKSASISSTMGPGLSIEF